MCETDYFRRLDLICEQCNSALRGSYITALGKKYHIDHFTCSVCPTIFGAEDSYYEHGDQVYCHYHYSTQFAQRCNGCHTAILKQFVEIFRNGQNQHWHPECYMIHKFWNVRLGSGLDLKEPEESRLPTEEDPMDEQGRNAVRDEEEKMEAKVYKIWSVLSTFEESSAACISDMLLHVSNGAYVDGVLVAKKFIWHVDILFRSADKLDATMSKAGPKGMLRSSDSQSGLTDVGLSYSREAKLLCKKIVAFFTLLSKTQEGGVRKLGVTQELLALVTGLAHYLKLLIRICLQGALRVEKEYQHSEGLLDFLDDLGDMEDVKNDDKSLEETTGVSGLGAADSDHCVVCKKAIEEECGQSGDQRWHLACLRCDHCSRELSQNLEDVRWSQQDQRVLCNNCEGHAIEPIVHLERVTRLQQYVFLLRVALARLLEMLRTSGTLPHTSDDPNLNGYNSNDGHKLSSLTEPPMLRSDTRSKSYGGNSDEKRMSTSYENTLNDVRRLRSTRMDRHLSSTKEARTSRVMEGPGGSEGPDSRNGSSKIDEERGDSRMELKYGQPGSLTLDDIPRIVAAEQAKEQRPNAYKHARHDMFRTSMTEPKLFDGHQRNLSSGNGLDQALPELSVPRGKKYFSELSALEYFIVRHVAVIAMQPMLEGHFTLEELLTLIDTKKPTFWNKMGKAFKADGKKAVKKKGVFGVPLDVIIERDGQDSTDGIGPGTLRIPAFIDDTISTMRKMDLSVEGVFRKNGNIKRLNDTVATIDREGCDAVDFAKENVVQVAALLKKYLRELPDPLLTFKLHRLFIASAKIQDEDKRRRVLHLTCCLLPKAHRDVLEILCCFFNWVASFHQVDEDTGSKMDTHNLATVIAPNILFTNAKTPVDDNFLAIEVVHSLIECNEQMCEVSCRILNTILLLTQQQVPEDLQSILGDPTLFSNPSDITTKEILKRYGDLGANGGPRHAVETTEVSALGRNNDGRALAPIFTRVDTDSSQAHAHQKEASVRHVQESSAPIAAPYAGNLNQNMPPQQWQDHDQSHVQEHNVDRRDHRNSNWGRPPNATERT